MIQPAKRLGLIPPYLFAEISRAKREAKERGLDIIDLGIGDPDVPTPEPIVEALCRSAHDPATHRYDETAQGWETFLQACADHMKREFGVELDPKSEIMESIGSKEALGHAMYAFLDHGDALLMPSPGYPVTSVNAKMAGAEVIDLTMGAETGWLPDLSTVSTEDARRAKVLYVNYPNNPTAALATREFYEDAVRFCREHDILLCADMAYASVMYDGAECVSPLQVDGGRDHVLEFHSLSKAFNMTGWRLGWVCGCAEGVRILQTLKNNLDSKQFPAIAEAGAFALNEGDNSAAIELYQKRRDYLCDGLASIGWDIPKPKATLFVWGPIPRSDMTSAEFCAELIDKTGIVGVPGSGAGEGFIRFSLTLMGDEGGERYAEAVRRIKESGLVGAPV